MALYRRGRVWYADYHADGVRVQESTGTANKREAEKILALRVSEVQRGVFVKPVNITLPEFGERYIEYAKAHKRSWKRDVQMLSNLQGFFGPSKLRDLMPGDVKPGTGFAQAYVQHCGTMGTAPGDESRPAREVPAGEQLPLPDA